MKRLSFFLFFILIMLIIVNEFIKKNSNEKSVYKNIRFENSNLDFNKNQKNQSSAILQVPNRSSIEGQSTTQIPNFRIKKEEKKRLIKKSDIKKQQQTSQNVFYIESLNTAFLSDIFACIDSLCTKQSPISRSNQFFIYKTKDSSKIKKDNQFLVVKNSNNPLYGVWENRLIIELNENRELQKDFSDMGLEEIEKPQDLLYIVLYNKPLSELNDMVLNIKSIPQVKNVTPELTFSKQKGNQWQKK